MSQTEVICLNFISQRATTAKIIANCLVAVILMIAIQIYFTIQSHEIPTNLNLRIPMFNINFLPDYVVNNSMSKESIMSYPNHTQCTEFEYNTIQE